ncbi:MAG: BatA domain-containing protein, partial [Planctomycetes bacterium]|nr:BatA domain-containing protein [Planctomycetota bacterium]
MIFDRPHLLWLLAALAPLAAAFLVRRRRPRVAVPDLDAWLAALPRAPRRGWRAFRDAASLLLNLAAAAAIALAAAGPRSAAPPHDDWALVFDTSASMSAADSRWKRALEKADAFARALPPGDRFRILEAGAVPRAIGGWREGGEGLPALPFPAEPSADLAGALELAGAARTVVFTDHDVPEASYLPRVAAPADNLAIEDLSFSRAWASPQIEVEARVVNYSAAARSPEVTFSCVARAAVPAGLILPGGFARVRVTLDAPAGGILEARLAPGDALSVDDAAFAVVSPLRAARAVVLAPRAESPFLRSALAALAPALETGSGVADILAESDALAAGADVFFYDRCTPSRAVPAVLIAAGSGPSVESPAVTAWAA